MKYITGATRKCSQTQNCVENQSNKMQHSQYIYMLGVKIKSKMGAGEGGVVLTSLQNIQEGISVISRAALSTGRRPPFPFSVGSFSRRQIESRRVFRKQKKPQKNPSLWWGSAALCLAT